jgi:hypothetical protein
MPLFYIETNNKFHDFIGNKNIFNNFKNIYLFISKIFFIYLNNNFNYCININ